MRSLWAAVAIVVVCVVGVFGVVVACGERVDGREVTPAASSR